MVFKDNEALSSLYESIAKQPVQIEEAKKAKKLSPAQKKIAQAAPPPDEITGADFAKLRKKKSTLKKEDLSFKDLFNRVISEKSSPFSPEPIVPHLDSDRKKLENIRKKRKEKEEAKKKKAK
jgi:hypothetical protein